MRFRLWFYFIKEALVNIVKNRVVHVIGLGTMIISLLIFGSFLLLFVNFNTWIYEWGQSLTMSIYLNDGISDLEKEKIVFYIHKLPSAEIKRFISKEDALRDLRRALGSQAGLFEGLSVNPLPASFELAFKDLEGNKVNLKGIKQKLEKMGGVEEVQYSEEWLHSFEGLIDLFKFIGFIIGGLLFMGVLFIVTNTMKLAIYSRRDEIEILKLVGATDWFVKIPFLVEGLIQGVLSGILAILMLYCGYLFLSSKIICFLGIAMLNFAFIPYEYMMLIFLISVALSFLGSFIAVGRFFDI